MVSAESNLFCKLQSFVKIGTERIKQMDRKDVQEDTIFILGKGPTDEIDISAME